MYHSIPDVLLLFSFQHLTTLCAIKKPFCGSLFSTQLEITFSSPTFFSFYVICVGNKHFSAIPALKTPTTHTLTGQNFFSEQLCCIYSYFLQENLSSVSTAAHLKRLSFLSISCNVFSAGLMICLKTWIKPFLPSLLPLTMHEFSIHTALLKEKQV